MAHATDSGSSFCRRHVETPHLTDKGGYGRHHRNLLTISIHKFLKDELFGPLIEVNMFGYAANCFPQQVPRCFASIQLRVKM
jgi:hypothetical protein